MSPFHLSNEVNRDHPFVPFLVFILSQNGSRCTLCDVDLVVHPTRTLLYQTPLLIVGIVSFVYPNPVMGTKTYRRYISLLGNQDIRGFPVSLVKVNPSVLSSPVLISSKHLVYEELLTGVKVLCEIVVVF